MPVPETMVLAAWQASTSPSVTKAEAQAMLEAALAVDADRCPMCGCDDIEHR